MKIKTTYKHGISFLVVAIEERLIDGMAVFDSKLIRYGATKERIVIRGNPWPVGTKVDFELVQIQHPGSRQIKV